MNGAYGEELIEYTGFQTVKGADGDVGRRVYLSANKFNATSELHIRRDGIKEVYFTDNNGQVRVVIDNNDAIVNKYDYKPFGGLYWSSDGTHLREGLDGSIYDPESDLQMMGFRMYDNETGRFITPDLLWSAFPAQSPYNYAYNSPLIFSDPSGLAPEKEKDSEELMNIEIDWDKINAAYSALDDENYRRSMERPYVIYKGWQFGVTSSLGESVGGKESRTGVQGGAWKISNNWTDEMQQKYQDYYQKRSKELVNEKAEVDCADVQFQILMEFARDNNLPLTLKRKNGDEYSQSDFKDFNSFLSFVKDKFSTADIAANTFEVNSKDKQIGDLALMILQPRTSDEFGNEVILDVGSMHCVGYQSVSPIRSFWGSHTNGVPVSVKDGGAWFEHQRIGDHNKYGALFNTRLPNFNTVYRWNYFNQRR